MKLDRKSLSALIKLSIFLTFTGGMTFVLMLLLTNGSFADRTEYHAIFNDVTGVTKGDEVRIAGVPVGSVKKVRIEGRDKAVVTFAVNSDTPLTANTTVTIRFRNLVGQRYLALQQGSSGAATVLKAGDTIGADQTREALDLNVLLNGFKPVFQALSPADTNQFAFEIVQTLQGEAGNVKSLLARTSSLTQTLAGRDRLIGDVIDNLTETLQFVGERDDQLTATVDTLQEFVTGLKEDRHAILDSIDSVTALSNETANLLVEGRPDLQNDIKQLNRLSANLAKPKNLKTVSDAVTILPIKMKKLGNVASNGSLFNFYLCELQLDVTAVPKHLRQLLTPLLKVQTGGHRCETGDPR